MRKTILVTGLGLALMASVAAAQSTTPDARNGAGKRGDRGGWNRGERPDSGARGGRFGGPRGDGMLLRGITLTSDQKAKLKTTREQFQAQRQTLRENNRSTFESARKARQSGDSAAMKASFDRMQGVLAQDAKIRDGEHAAIRTVLTAEQRTVFDKNLAELEEREAKRGERGCGKGGGRKGGERTQSGNALRNR
jgi:Spy/CpxP family protein refolding chaperone